jgi:hypothetical protein
MTRRLREHHEDLRQAEVWLKDVPRHGSFRVALVYPNLYYVGMSNLGFQCVFDMLNALPDVVCERAFLPDDVHSAELERTGQPLVTLDSGTPLRDFDMVAAWSVDRLGRSLQDLVSFLGELSGKHVDLYLHQQGLDTSTPAGRAMFQMLGVFAEFERAMIRERVNAGLARAKAQGKRLGRPPVTPMIADRVKRARDKGLSVRKIAAKFELGLATVQRIVTAEETA